MRRKAPEITLGSPTIACIGHQYLWRTNYSKPKNSWTRTLVSMIISSVSSRSKPGLCHQYSKFPKRQIVALMHRLNHLQRLWCTRRTMQSQWVLFLVLGKSARTWWPWRWTKSKTMNLIIVQSGRPRLSTSKRGNKASTRSRLQITLQQSFLHTSWLKPMDGKSRTIIRYRLIIMYRPTICHWYGATSTGKQAILGRTVF